MKSNSDNILEINNENKSKRTLSSLLKIEKNEAGKVKIFDMLLILAVVLTVGIFSFLIVNKVFSKDYKGNVLYYNLTFDSNGGSELSSVKVKEGYVDLPTKVEKAGYDFDGWIVEEKIVDNKYYVKENTLFKAQWKKIEIAENQIIGEGINYSITFDFDDGSELYVETVLAGSSINRPSDPVREGYTFVCWYHNEAEYDFNSVVTGDMVLIAQWSKDDNTSNSNNSNNSNNSGNSSNNVQKVYHTVTFDLNGGGTNYTKKVESGKKVAKPNDPSRSGYIFNGWTLSASNYNFNNGVKQDITLVAQWKKKEIIKYEVKFDPLNGDAVISQFVDEEKTASKPNADPVKIGYTFLGWYREDRSQYNFSNGVTSNMTLYALWIPKRNLNDKSSNGKKRFYITTPTDINSTDYLADDNYAKKLLFKSSFNGNAEVYYSHKMSGALSNNASYVVRIFNRSDKQETITINKCGISTGNNFTNLWKQYNGGGCDAAGTYTIEAHGCLLIFHKGNSFGIQMVNDQSGVPKLSGSFEGILDLTSSTEMDIAFLAFKDISKTYNAGYTP